MTKSTRLALTASITIALLRFTGLVPDSAIATAVFAALIAGIWLGVFLAWLGRRYERT